MTQPMLQNSVLSPAGPIALRSSEISWVLIYGASVVFCIVLVILLWALLRRRPADAAPMSKLKARCWIWGGGVVFPLVVLSSLLAYDIARTAPLTPHQNGDAMVITVKAHLWWWEVRYRHPRDGSEVVLANQIRLPVGRKLTAGLVSNDVIHSLWVPALGGKVDMVPGRVNQMTLLADRAGSFRGQCAEYCGDQHARMGLEVIAMEADAFDRWLDEQAEPAAEPIEAEARRGLQVFTEQGCHNCHAVRGLFDSSLGVGPDLTHLASRQRIGAGALPLSDAALAQWISDVQRVKPGARMPSYEHLDPAALQALVTFLMQLK